jgi:hypothetical protein
MPPTRQSASSPLTLPEGWESWNAAEKQLLLETLRQAKADRTPRDPAGWARFYGLWLWSMQREFAQSVRDHKRTVVQSGAGIGKSYITAVIVCWWVCTHPPDDVYVWTTAPGGEQVSGVLWEDIRKLHARLGLPGRVGLDNKWRIGNVLVASGRKPADKAAGAEEDPDTGQGFHRRYLLVVLDDAGGLDEWLWDTAENITTGDDCRIAATGNPDHAGSKFAKVCASHKLWTHLAVSVFDSPNFTGEDVPEDIAAKMTTRTWVEERRLEWGEDDRRYVSKVLGRFPADHPQQVVPAGALKACQFPDIQPPSALVPVELGVDVGGGSDLTVVRERRGIKAGRRWAVRTSDPEKAARLILDGILETGAASVKVDANGVGWGIVGLLRDWGRRGEHAAEIHAVMVGEKSREPGKYANLRAELWWTIGRLGSQRREWDLSGMAEAEKVQTELLTPRWDLDNKGRIVIEAKQDIRDRTSGASPDDADALLLAFYVPHDAMGSYFEAMTSGKLRG